MSKELLRQKVLPSGELLRQKVVPSGELPAFELAQRIQKLNERWEPHPGQIKAGQAIFRDKKKRLFIRAGRKWGKTEKVMYIAWRIALTTDNPQVYIIGPSQKQQKEIMWQNGRLRRFGPEEYIEQVMESELRLKINGGFIKVDGSENFEAYRGTEYHAMILDEMKDQDPRFYDAAYPNLRSLDGLLVCIGTPPDTPANFYVELLNEIQKDEDWAHVHGTAWENPWIEGEKDLEAAHKWLEKEREKYLARGDKERWLREYEAELAFGGRSRVIPNISRLEHMKPAFHVEELLQGHAGKLEWYVILDPGTSVCFAGLFAAINPHTSQVFLLDEIYEKDTFKTSVDQIWPQIVSKCNYFHKGNDWRVFYDDAAAWFGNEVLSRYGVYCSPAGKFSADKELGISTLKDIARVKNCLTVSDKCENWFWELENYIRDDNGKIPKKNDHLIDCTRYLFTCSRYELNESPEPEPEEPKRYVTLEEDLRTWRQQSDILYGKEVNIFDEGEWW